MLFNSLYFIFLFLPLAVVSFYACRRINFNLAIIVLALFSFFFYAYWAPVYILLFVGSIIVNFLIADYIHKLANDRKNRGKLVLYATIALNLILLFYFKYTGFALENIVAVTGWNISVPEIVLPIGISFFTFQQIAYQVDIYRGLVKDHEFWKYSLFVSFFPHLIAGPIVHHSEMMPQFAKRTHRPLQTGNIAIGITIFAIGLFKKVIIADSLSAYAGPVFNDALHGENVDFYAAWIGALAYTFQIYFDFSGYSDMAVGGARLFGICLPVNFFSPYKATSMIDFWRRWHMTLSRFFRDYIYIPLGGNRKGPYRQLLNIFIVMILVGFWHGADWTFVVWGLYHGILIVLNHLWRNSTKGITLPALPGFFITFLFVAIGWIFFRAESMGAAWTMLAGMSGLHGLSLPVHFFLYGLVPDGLGITVSTAGAKAAMIVSVAACIAFLMPNSVELMKKYRPVLMPNTSFADWSALKLRWKPTVLWALFTAVIFLWSVGGMLSGETEFLYFNF